MYFLNMTNRTQIHEFIRRLNRGHFSRHNYKIWRFIRGMEVDNKCKISAKISPQLCLLGQKNTGT